MDYQPQNFETALALQEKLSKKREELGYEEFYKRVDSVLPTTMVRVAEANKIVFGRRYQDDIFSSIEIRYPDVTMGDVRKIADIICL